MPQISDCSTITNSALEKTDEIDRLHQQHQEEHKNVVAGYEENIRESVAEEFDL